MGKLENQIALVTGGSRGIGLAIARAFTAEGATVAITYHPSESSPQQLKEDGAIDWFAPMEAANPESVREACASVIERYGRVDILVTNAGYAEISSVMDLTIEQFDRMTAVHLRAPFLCVQAVLPGMIERQQGKIITIGSQIAYIGAVGLAHYTAAKAGVIGFTRSLAREVIGDGINVNCIAPGAIATGILPSTPEEDAEILRGIPAGRFGTPDEIAPTAVLLASRDGDFYVGQVLSPNGGEVML